MAGMRKRVCWGVLVVALALPAAALGATGWIAIPAKYAPKLRATVMSPAVKAVGGVRITACSFEQRHRFYVCVYGTQAAPKKGAIEIERTKRCDYTVFDVDLANARKPRVTHHSSFHRCY